MYKTELKEKFKKHLYKLSSDESMREMVLEFYDNFSKLFHNEFYTRDDFDTIDLDGTVIEQDVVKNLFKDKTVDRVSAIELYVELFCQDVKSIKPIDFGDDSMKEGCYDFKSKCLTLKKTSPEDLYYKYISGKDLKEEFPKQYKKRVKNIRKSMDDILKENDETYAPVVRYCIDTAKRKDKETMSHELAHVFAMRLFQRKFCMDCYVKGLLVRVNRYQAIIDNGAGKFCYKDNLLKLKRGSVQRRVAESMFCGLREIAEISNEVLSRKILDGKVGLQSNENRLHYLTRENYISRMELCSDVLYNANYYILRFLDCIKPGFEDDVMKCKKSSIVQEIKDLEIDSQVLHDCQERIANLAKQMPELSIQDECVLAEALNNMGAFNTILFCCSMIRFVKNSEKRNVFNNFTIESQAILVQAIKEKITSELKDQNIEKNEEFFKQVSDTLFEVGSYLLLPNEEGVYEYLPKYAHELDSNIHKFTTHSTKRFAEEHPNLKHIAIFNELVNDVRQEINKFNPEGSLFYKLQFFRDEIEYDSRFKFVMANTATPIDIIQDEILESVEEDKVDLDTRFEELLEDCEQYYDSTYPADNNVNIQGNNELNSEDKVKPEGKHNSNDNQSPEIDEGGGYSDNMGSEGTEIDYEEILAKLLGE